MQLEVQTRRNKVAAKAVPALAVVPHERFTASERKAITKYVSDLQVLMRLQDWTITIDFNEVASDESYADMDAGSHQKWATLRLGDAFLGLDGRLQTQVLIHEVMHCHTFCLDHTMTDVIGSLGSKSGQKVAGAVLTGQIEIVVDSMADILMDLLPPLALEPR